jgi:WD40-like Beta Propeller Repeat
VVSLTPAAAAVGWARADDTAANHFGDYNVYAGVYGGQAILGAIQFDLSAIPPGAPIAYADLTLVGLSGSWLGAEGGWTVQLLKVWLDPDWPQRTYANLALSDAVAVNLEPSLVVGDLAEGQINRFVLSDEALQALESRTLTTGRVSLRIIGPTSGADNLFSWDSGYGAGSQGMKPVLRIAAGPAPAIRPTAPTPEYVLITSTPTPENVVTRAAQAATATAQAATTGTPTPLPLNWVTPMIYVPTATPANAVTARWHAAEATANAFLTGTPAALPGPVWTATPRPLVIPLLQVTLTATPNTPDELVGKIAFWSDRLGGQRLFVMNPDGSGVALLTQSYPYDATLLRDTLSPRGGRQVIVLRDSAGIAQLFGRTLSSGAVWPITALTRSALEPAWWPSGERIVFVSTQDGNEEIYVIDVDPLTETGGTNPRRLTTNTWQADRHPSWSPDGERIVFASGRTAGRNQIWVMNADGSGQVNISNNDYSEWSPVWIK